jgi:hypothetical protein
VAFGVVFKITILIKIGISLHLIFFANFLQDDKNYAEPVEQSVPTTIQTNKNDELLNWHENKMWRQSVRKSRLGRGMETILLASYGLNKCSCTHTYTLFICPHKLFELTYLSLPTSISTYETIWKSL